MSVSVRSSAGRFVAATNSLRRFAPPDGAPRLVGVIAPYLHNRPVRVVANLITDQQILIYTMRAFILANTNITIIMRVAKILDIEIFNKTSTW